MKLRKWVKVVLSLVVASFCICVSRATIYMTLLAIVPLLLTYNILLIKK